MASALPEPTQSQLILPAPIKGGKLEGLAGSRNALTTHYEWCLESLTFLAECQARWNASEGVEVLEQALKETIDARHDAASVVSSIAALAGEHARGLVLADTAQSLLERTEVSKSNYRDLPDLQKYASVPAFEEFKRRVFDVQHPEDDYPGTASFFTTTKGSGRDGEEEGLEMTWAGKRNLKCPITMMTFQQPMRSRVCVHIYSKHAVMEMLSRNRGMIDCPVPGCDKKITAHTIERDRAMERRVREEEEGGDEDEDEARQGEELSSEAGGSEVLDVF